MAGKKQEIVVKHTKDELKEMQQWDLDHKIQVSKARIIEFATKFEDKIYVSFSGGKDSTVLLHLVRSIYPDTVAAYVDTGLEYPELREFVKTIPNVIWLKPKMNFRKVIEIYGYPIVSKEVAKRVYEYHNAEKKGKLTECLAYQEFNGIRESNNGKSFYNKNKWKFLIDANFLISHKCCDIMKKKPSKEFEKMSGLKPIIGTMACESKIRETVWINHGCNAFNTARPSSQPLSFWTEQDVLMYLKKYNIPYSSVYGEIIADDKGKLHTTGCSRTGCIFCGFGCHLEKEPNRFQMLKQTHPKLWDYCMRPLDKGGLNMREVLDYIGVKIE